METKKTTPAIKKEKSNSRKEIIKEKRSKTSTKQKVVNSTKTNKSTKENKEQQKREIDFTNRLKPANKKINLKDDFNNNTMFDVYLYRELFMELRKQMDELSAKRNKGDKEYAAYDEAVYNITSNAVNDPGAQDFLGFCYKKGFYDFCIMNYEKYMKWTILAAANGNAFSLSKLQIYLTTAIDKIMEVENQDLLIDFLDITGENYMILISKMLCENIVKIMHITSEELIKMPEKYVEANEQIQKEFDNAKMQAAELVYQDIKKSVEQIDLSLKEQIKIEDAAKQELKNKTEFENIKTIEISNEEPNKIGEDINEKQEEPESKFKRNLKIRKKFRY